MNEVTAHARRSDVETSHEAAATVRIKTDAKQTLDWLGHLRDHGYLVFTFKQISAARAERLCWPRGWRISESGLRSRIGELRESGYVQWATNAEGEQMYDPPNGRRSRCMSLTAKGYDAFSYDQEVELVKRSRKSDERDRVLAAVRQAAEERGLPSTVEVIIGRALEILG